MIRKEVEQLGNRTRRGVERQLRLRRLQNVVKRRAALFCGTLRQPHQIGGFEVPGRRRQHAGAGDVIEWSGDEPQIRQHVPHERMFEDGQFRNDKGNFPAGKFFDNFVAVSMLPVEHRKILPAAARCMKPLELVRNPARFVIRGGQLRDANPLAFRLG